jgi:flavin-dependent dehydrogenase
MHYKMYDVAIIGGGLAGLFAAHELARYGHEVVLLERKSYPFHRVCGEYISNEVKPLLESRDLFPHHLIPTPIDRLEVSAPDGALLRYPLEMGGFGVSRYALDAWWASLLPAKGVQLLQGVTASEVYFDQDHFRIVLHTGQEITARVAIGAFGKRSMLDKTLQRSFMQARSPYVGVKYHIHFAHPRGLIGLHNFKGGYCGISHVEEDRVNLCYLAERAGVKSAGSIEGFEQKVLRGNPYLNTIFREGTFLFEKPEVINEISFAPKAPVEQHLLMIGDTAGLITPLCGNGMAMAIHGAWIASGWVHTFLKKEISRVQLEAEYAHMWHRVFGLRLKAGRTLQRLFGEPISTTVAVRLLDKMPFALRKLIALTHGKVVPIDFVYTPQMLQKSLYS